MNETVKNKIAKYSILGLAAALLVINWNSYSLFTVAGKWNPVLMGAVLSVVLLLVCDVRSLIKDRMFWFVAAINAVSLINIMIDKTGLYEFFPLFALTLGLYLTDKVKFAKKDILILSAIAGFFFVYWTVDVKGYYKGYTINYGGLVLISGFIFVMFLLEYFRFKVLSSETDKTPEKLKKLYKFLKKYPYIFSAIEILMFLWAYFIISWYRSRTAFFALIVLAVLMLIPRKVLGNKIVYCISVIATLAGGFLFPLFYIYVGNRVNRSDYYMFYKDLIDYRVEAWSSLIEVYKNFPVTGVGTIYTDNEIFRPGLLDTMNAYVDMLLVHGPFVCLAVVILIAVILIKLQPKVSISRLAKMSYVGVLTILIASYAESMFVTVPFSLLFVLLISFADNMDSEECFGDISSYKTIDFAKYKRRFSKDFGKKIGATALAVLLPVVLVFVLGPVEVYYSNYDEFSFTNNDYLWIFLALAFIIAFISVTVISVLPDKINKVILVLLSAVSVASYVQYMFLNKNLIMEDGEFLAAEDLGTYPTTTLIIYIGIFALICIMAFAFRKNEYQFITIVSGFILVITLIATLSLFLTHITSRKESKWYSGEDEFKVAPEDNVIVIVPDTFGREALDSMLEVYPDAIDFLNDFTYYEKEDSEYFPTYPALHHMLTAAPYDSSMSRYEYTKTAFESDTAHDFFDTLHKKDYTVRLFTRDILFENMTEGLVDNVEDAHITIDRRSLFKFLFRMSMYRYVPYALKAPFQVETLEIDNINHYNGTGSYFLNSDFYKAMGEQGVTVDDTIENAFIMHHIRGAHMPYLSNANNELVPDNSVSGEETSYGTMALIKEYIDHLKSIGKYEDSIIIIVADHGFYKTDSIFFVKQKGEKHDEMAVSDEELKHADFQKFVIESIESER